MERTRTVSWDNPLKDLEQAKGMHGLEYLQAMDAGTIGYSPVASMLDFKIRHLEAGKVIFYFQPQEFHYNPIGTVHGGVISTILDSAMGCTLHSMLPPGTGYTTLELKVNFIKAATTASGELFAEGRIIHLGSRTALVEAQLKDSNNTVYAHAVSTCMILKY